MSTVAAFLVVAGSAAPSYAQGVTTSAITGVVMDSQGAVVPGVTVSAVHEPSGTSYQAVTQTDGRYTIAGMRVGGPYKVSAELSGFSTAERSNLTLNLGVTTDISFDLGLATVSETVQVVGQVNPVFSSGRTGAATAVSREELATLPTVTGRITDITRLTPQYGGSGTFAGQDNRANNITVDGSYFNNSFGLGTSTGGIGDRTGVAPISLEAIEQVQVNVAPYDVRQGNFTGAGVNTVTRSGTNNFTGSGYYRFRNDSNWSVGREANGQEFKPGTFDFKVMGGWLGGPVVKNKLFAFVSVEKQEDKRPLNTFRANLGGEPVAGNVTRVLASELNALSAFLRTNFNYETGAYENIPKTTPGTPWMVKGDYNVSGANKITFRYNQLNSSTDVNQSGSSSLGVSRQTFSSNFLNYANSNYKILENLKSGIGEWNSAFGTFTNNLIVGYTFQDESRDQLSTLFPFVVIGDGVGNPITSFGSEPFTPFNLLSYKTFQAQDSFTKYSKNHSLTFGGAVEKFHSDNSFYFGLQSAYSYNSLTDFYADANGYLADRNRTVAAAANRFQTRYLLQPGQTTPPMQPLDVFYSSAYVQDEWRPRTNLTVTGGIRMDIPKFGNTAFPNPAADALTFRDQDGSPVKYTTNSLPDTVPYWSPRIGFNWDVTGNQATQVRGGTGVFTGKPPYVWISNQIGNTGVLSGFLDTQTFNTSYPFNPNPDRYKPAPTGAAAASYELNVTDKGFRFPQTWRTNIGVDRKLPWGFVATTDFIYNRDLNAPVYINANLPAAQATYTGADKRPRWASSAGPVPGVATCVTTIGSENGPCAVRINNARGNAITAAYVIKNQSNNRSWNYSASLTKLMSHGFSMKSGFSYGVSKSVVEPSSTAGSSWGSANPISLDPNNPDLAYSQNSPGHRFFTQAGYSKQYFGFGATTVSIYFENRTNGNTSYIFSGDANGDTVPQNDLIYIPRNTSEMNFTTFTTGGRTYPAAEQAAAFEAYIVQDKYLSAHRGEYAQRGAVFLPALNRMDLSLTQDLFKSLGRKRHSGSIRLDVTNFGNWLNSNWGAGKRIINTQILTNPTVDATGALAYRLQLLGGNYITQSHQTSAGLADVYTAMLSFRYTFN